MLKKISYMTAGESHGKGLIGIIEASKNLKSELAKAVEGKAFLVQGGDCAESFKEFNANNIRDTFRVLLQMSAVITSKMKVPVIKLGRIAGQFAKPRSSDTETVDGVTLNSYYGDSINGIEFTEKDRNPNPALVVVPSKGISLSALSLIGIFELGLHPIFPSLSA